MKSSHAQIINADNECRIWGNIESFVNGLKDGCVVTHLEFSECKTLCLIIYTKEY
jgi:hypothetical protein